MHGKLRNPLSSLLILLIKFYQKVISPSMPPTCRYVPTCSEYSKQAFTKYPFFKAFLLSAGRVLRCHPFSKGGYDPLK